MAETRNDDRIAPVALPAGSFDLHKLGKALDDAVSVKNREQHPERITRAIVDTIADPRILANQDRQAVPTGAKAVDQETVYAAGQEPVKTPGIAFQPVKADSGTEASRMRYDERSGEVSAVDASEAALPAHSDAESSLSDQAAERVEHSSHSPKTGSAKEK